MILSYESLIAANADIYYQVGDKKFADKLSAVIASNGDIGAVRYCWRESLYDHVEWCNEPSQDLAELVDQHVRCIRDSYDHVALWFSGGFDSYAIFKAFQRNGLKIDEFLIFDREWNQGLCEMDSLAAAQTAAAIKQTVWPALKITKVQWGSTDAVYRFFRKHGSDWIYNANNIFWISQNSREFLYSMNDDVRRIGDSKGSSIVINGIDKPRLDLRDGYWHSFRTDASFYSEKDPWTLHFWTLPDLYVKQCWMMLRWLESLSDMDHKRVHDLQSHQLGDSYYTAWNVAIGRDMPMHLFCQSLGNKQTWQGSINCPEAQPLMRYTSLAAPDVLQSYHRGIGQMARLCGDAWNKESLPTMISKPYAVTRKTSRC